MRSDREIIAEVLAGAAERLGELVDRHGGVLLGFLERRATDSEHAKDAFQETWLRALERLGELRNPERFRAWIMTIAWNIVRADVRRPGRESLRLERDEGALELADEQRSPGRALEVQESAGRLREQLERLPARQRDVFELRVLGELSHAEIARALSIREDNARANYYQAVRKLRAFLGDDSDD